MSTSRKRKVTLSILFTAGSLILVALCLAGPRFKSRSSEPAPAAPAKSSTHKMSSKIPMVAKIAPSKAAPVESSPPLTKEPPKVDVVFVLDTTGSMSGLIAGAKRNIWSIANQIIQGEPRPLLRVGLIGYRDLGDEYVTKRFSLDENIDGVYAHLMRFQAQGGGDTPEHVNKALAEAIRNMQWRKGQNVLRQIYLVGDAPPHEGREGLYSRKLAREALAKGIVINTVRCGSQSDTAASWRTIARLSGGTFTSVRQDGAMMAMKTPYDKHLAELNLKLSKSLLAVGSSGEKRAAEGRAKVNAAMPALAQAESAKFRALSGHIDSSDLLTQIARGKKINDFKEDELPEEVASLDKDDRAAYIKRMTKRRSELKAQILKLSKARDSFIRSKRSVKEKGLKDSIGSALKAQGAEAGIAY